MHNMHTTQPPGASLVVESYRAQLSESSKYISIAGFERDMPYFCLQRPTGGGKTWLAARSVHRSAEPASRFRLHGLYEFSLVCIGKKLNYTFVQTGKRCWRQLP